VQLVRVLRSRAGLSPTRAVSRPPTASTNRRSVRGLPAGSSSRRTRRGRTSCTSSTTRSSPPRPGGWVQARTGASSVRREARSAWHSLCRRPARSGRVSVLAPRQQGIAAGRSTATWSTPTSTTDRAWRAAEAVVGSARAKKLDGQRGTAQRLARARATASAGLPTKGGP
jgi:hypothetical protein